MFRTKLCIFSFVIVAVIAVQAGATVSVDWTVTPLVDGGGPYDSIILNNNVLNAINIGGRELDPPSTSRYPSKDVTVNGVFFKGMGPFNFGSYTDNGITIAYDGFTFDPLVADPANPFSSTSAGGFFPAPVDAAADPTGEGGYNLFGAHLFTSGDDRRNFPIEISGLEIGKIYDVQMLWGTGGSTNRTGTYYLDTVDPAHSSGSMESLPPGFGSLRRYWSAVARFTADSVQHNILMGDGMTGRTIVSAVSVSLVPEPTSLALLAVAGFGLACVRRTRR